ncbi:MAG: LacI family DNA-binding transcriptional regulator [Treponema sp.]|jgi:LacI family transcriptional regulator|nr:LacI family DNA-binding transcriptional regulator [Treponema sp.]
MVTMKDIARLAKTSLGTVDRALNNRPEVNEKTRKKILQIAESLNYTPNHLGKALGLKKQNIKLGFILEPTVNPYFLGIKQGIDQRSTELEHYGISTATFAMNSYNEREQIDLLDKLRDMGVSGIAINVINTPAVQKKIDALVKKGIRIVTCNSDITESKRSCYVGFENERSGRVAAEILAKLCGERGKVVIGIGFKYLQALMERLKGFSEKIHESYPHVAIERIIEIEENNKVAFEKALNTLKSCTEICGFYNTGFGVQGIIEAIKISKPKKKIRVICHDHTPQNEAYIKAGLVDVLICQDPVKHGYMAMKLLSEMVINNKEPENKIYLTSVEIKFAENLETSSRNQLI